MSHPHHPLISRAAALALLLLAGGAVRGSAQTASDSGARVGPRPDSAAGHGDSSRTGVDTAPTGAPGDSARPAAGDTTRAPARDTTRPAARETIAPPNASVAPPAPADSVLAGACAAARPGMVAPGLLIVAFRDAATPAERAAALKEAGSMEAGTAPDGGSYVRVVAESISVRTAADQLSLNPAVAAVSERSCPAGSPPR